jgi:hypothetical protein
MQRQAARGGVGFVLGRSNWSIEVARQTGLDHLLSITTDAAARRAQPASDHAAVLAHLQL